MSKKTKYKNKQTITVPKIENIEQFDNATLTFNAVKEVDGIITFELVKIVKTDTGEELTKVDYPGILEKMLPKIIQQRITKEKTIEIQLKYDKD